MYKYVKDLPPIALDELDIRKFINNDFPLTKLGTGRFSIRGAV